MRTGVFIVITARWAPKIIIMGSSGEGGTNGRAERAIPAVEVDDKEASSLTSSKSPRVATTGAPSLSLFSPSLPYLGEHWFLIFWTVVAVDLVCRSPLSPLFLDHGIR